MSRRHHDSEDRGPTPAPIVLALDVGRTGCRAALWNGDAAEPAAIAAGDGSPGLGAANGSAVAEAAILAIVKPLLKSHVVGHIDAVGVGAPCAMEVPALARQLAERLARSLPARMVAVMSDAITSHAGALGGKPGVVLAAGTGAVTVAIGAHGRFRRADGWGPWIGDEGSGAWLGRSGMQAAARALDGRGPATILMEAAARQFGSVGELVMKLGSDPNPARSMAVFAPAVAEAARNGDAVALRVMEAGATALAHSMIAAANALDSAEPVTGVVIGGLVNLGSILLDPLCAALERSGANLQLRPAEGTSIDGARHLALVDNGIHEPWVVRARGEDP
ncbi:MAG TPA: BadF/BadG/BcrA/BcrD ATPase family protein [Rhodanobacteraceae bacterium]|nr:BadF/BadG/BcrA/BcrD ATPase family protein [Rhodanobacteraceae bacterium]